MVSLNDIREFLKLRITFETQSSYSFTTEYVATPKRPRIMGIVGAAPINLRLGPPKMYPIE